MTFLTKHFTLEELTRSATAIAKGIDNRPDAESLKNLQDLCAHMLEPLRLSWGSAIIVSSCFRGPALNAAIGGSKTSAHMHGHAADIVPANGDMARFKKFVKRWCAMHPFDQCIDEQNAHGTEWMHISLCNNNGQQRRQFLKTTDAVHYTNDLDRGL